MKKIICCFGGALVHACRYEVQETSDEFILFSYSKLRFLTAISYLAPRFSRRVGKLRPDPPIHRQIRPYSHKP
ncbi:hypothetical protein EMIT0P43_20314 [Pseudomonas jessenii]